MPHTLIDSAKHVVLVAHKNPDADSLGSACAFYSYLLRSQKKITLYCATGLGNRNLGFLPWSEKLTTKFPDDIDLVISFDCGSRARMGCESDAPLINFDHHQSNEMFGTINFMDTQAISTTQVVFDFFVANDIKINGKMATALYAGLVDDSKCFTHSACNSKTFEMARVLLECGAEHEKCIEWLYNRRPLSSLRLRGNLLKQAKLYLDGRLALFEVTKSLLEETGASISECKGALDEALALATVRVAMLCVEHPQGGTKISLRTDGSVDAAEIAAIYGGGGHKNRAGSRMKDLDYRQVTQELVEHIKRSLSEKRP